MSEAIELQKQVEQALRTFAEMLLPTMRRLRDAMIDAAQKVDSILWDAYEQAGCPYGQNFAGRNRWLRERAEVERLRARADEIEMWHDALVEIRELTGRRS